MYCLWKQVFDCFQLTKAACSTNALMFKEAQESQSVVVLLINTSVCDNVFAHYFNVLQNLGINVQSWFAKTKYEMLCLIYKVVIIIQFSSVSFTVNSTTFKTLANNLRSSQSVYT